MRKNLVQRLCSLTALFAAGLLLGGVAWAQEVTGSIVGTVRDSNGAAIAGATVSIADAAKGDILVRRVTSDGNGEFSVPNLSITVYKITAEASNFKKGVQTGVKLDVGQRRNVDITLEAGNIAEVVTVEADPVAVESTTPTSSTLITGDQAREISLNNRNFIQMVALAPGVSNDLADQVYVGTTNPDGQANIVSIAVNGARSSQNTFTVDGADITDRGSNLTIQAYPSLDSVAEFKVLRSLYPAESGRSGGGQINIVTRSGGNKFHGSLFEFTRNDAFNANSYLLNLTTNPPFGRNPDNGKAKRPPIRYNNYGWTLGGPIVFPKFGERDPGDSYFHKVKDTFFFFSQEFRRDNRASSAVTTSVPDINLRRGVFPIDVCINRPALGEAACTGAFRLAAGTPIPAAFLSPTAQGYITGIYNSLSLPNTPSVNNPFALITTLQNKSRFRQEVIKIDRRFSSKISGYYRYQHDDIPTIDGNALFSSGSGLPGVSTTSTNSPGYTHTGQVTYAVTSRFILEGRYNYAYGAILSENIGLLALRNTNVPVTLPFTNTRDRVPTLTGNGFTGLTSFGPYDNFSNKNSINASATWILKSHTLKFGFSNANYRKNENALAGNNEGNYSVFGTTLPTGQTFPQNYTVPGSGAVLTGAITTAVSQNLQRWANFLVGNVQTFTQARFDYTADLRQKATEAYAQDEWRARRNLTLYYGVRYSYFPLPMDKNGRLTNFVPSLFNAAAAPQVTGAGSRVAGTGNFCNGLIVNSQNFQTGPSVFGCTPTPSPFGDSVVDVPTKDFAPRVGFAWDPFGKGRTAIRTGYGVYHEQVLNGTFLQNIGTNPPFQENATGTATRLDNPVSGTAFSLTPQGLRALQPDWNTPYMQHWSLDVQHQLAKKTIFSLGYYGSKGTHLIGVTELNDLPAGKARNSTCAPGNGFYAQTPAPTLVTCQPNGYAFRNTAAATGNPNVVGTTTFTDILILDQLRPYRGFRSIAMVMPRYDSNYHSLQISAEQRFSGISMVKLAYTFAKNLTNSQNDRTTSPQDTYDIKSEYARAFLDRKHVLSVNYIYELPFFRKQTDLVGKVLGGWQASGIVTYNSGLPFTAVTSNLDYAGLGLINANPAARPNLLCNPNANAPHSRDVYVSNACFVLNPPNTGTGSTGLPTAPGTAGRGIIEGPTTTRIDFTLVKNIRFGENLRLQLRAEAFNILNHTNFRGFTSLNVTSTAFGQIGTVRDPRTMQFAAKFNF